MIYNVCAVRDAKAEAFGQPFYSQQRGIAVRSFADECSREDSNLKKHPEDYALFELGKFDEQTGELTSHPQPIQIALAMDYVVKN